MRTSCGNGFRRRVTNLAKEDFHIEGISCAACVRRLENGLNDLEGVRSATVNFATSKATVEYDSNVLNDEEIKQRIRDIGYDATDLYPAQKGRPDKTQVIIGGMTCAACVRRVETGSKINSGGRGRARKFSNLQGYGHPPATQYRYCPA